MLDALILPALALLIVVFLVYIWQAWLKDESGRSLRIPGDEDDAEGSPPALD